MGCQGEICNVLGLKLPASELKKDKLYSVNGKTVATVEEYRGRADFFHGTNAQLGGLDVDLKDPFFNVWLLGYGGDLKGRHFQREALVGYTIADECYIHRATALPSFEVINKLKSRLVKDLKKRLDLDVELSRLEVFLLFDYMQGYDY